MELVPAAPPLEPLPESPTSPREMDVSDAFLMQAVMDGLMAPGKDGADGSSSSEEPEEPSESEIAAEIVAVSKEAAAAFAAGDAQAAAEEWEACLNEAVELGDAKTEGALAANLGSAYRKLGRLELAAEHCTRAVEIAQQTGDRAAEGGLR